MGWRRVAALDDVWGGELFPVAVGDVKVVLVRFDDEIHAYVDRCAHLGLPLSRGRLEGRTLICQAHEWSYDATTGCGINPERVRLKRVAVMVADGAILIDLEGG